KAIKKLDLASIKFLIPMYYNVDYNNNWPLITAVQHSKKSGQSQSIKVIQYLLSLGANVQAQGNAALKLATENGNDKLIKLLLDAGADPNVALLSTENIKIKILELLIGDGSNIDPKIIVDAARYRNISYLQLLVHTLN